MEEVEGPANGAGDLQLSGVVDIPDDDKNFDTIQSKRRKVMSGRRHDKRLILLLTKPLYSLSLGYMNARHEHRARLRDILRKLVRQQNWVEASGVLSTLLKGTCKEDSLLNTRMKYWVAMELMKYVESDTFVYTKEIERLYSMWMGKIHSWKNKPLKDKYAKLESILSVLAHHTKRSSVVPGVGRVMGSQETVDLISDELTLSRRLNDAREDARSLTLERESANDPATNLTIGLTFWEDWYSTLPKEMQFKNISEWCTPSDSDTVGFNSCEKQEDMKWDDAASIYEAHSYSHYHSETSVVNDKDANGSFDRSPRVEASSGNISLPLVPHQQIQKGFYASSSETSAENDGAFEDYPGKIQLSSIFSVRGLQSVLPIRFPSSEDMAYLLSSYERSFDDTYKNAVKHLKFAFESPPPFSEAALLPLIQLLLLGGQTKEAFLVVDESCSQGNSILPLRLRVYLWECFYPNDTDKLPTYLEELLKEDPRCSESVAKLVSLHQKGDYATENLLDMIALHLEAAYPDYNTWREFASCLLRVFHREEDRASVCMGGDEDDSVEEVFDKSYNKIPDLFVKGVSKKTWKLRCRWWLNRHFGRNMLASDISAGNLQLMTYKAACASYLYGKESEYVTKIDKHLNEHDKLLLSSLHLLQIQNSIDLQSFFFRK